MNYNVIWRFPKINLCLGALLSLLFSWIVCTQSIIINNDGTLYLRGAEAFGYGGWEAAYAVYPWPFYAILIYWVSQIGVSPLIAAYWVDAGLLALLTVTFMAIGRVIHTSPKYDYLYLFVILLFPTLNDYREFIVRDFGFYAYNLIALYAMLRANLEQRVTWVLFASGALFVSGLFRIEGMIYFMLLPFLCFGLTSVPWLQRRWYCMLAVSPMLFCLLGLGLAWSLHPDFVTTHVGRLQELWQKFAMLGSWVHHSYTTMIATTKSHLLNRYAAIDASWIILGGMTFYYFKILLQTFTLIYAWLCYLGWRHAPPRLTATIPMVILFTAVGFGITYVFLLTDWFITGRYVLAIVFTFMLAVPSGCIWIASSLQNWQQSWQYRAAWLGIGCIMVFLILQGLVSFGDQKTQVPEASQWLQNHVPDNEKIFSNNRQILYENKQTGEIWLQFTNNPPERDLIVLNKIKPYRYAALEIIRDERADVINAMHTISFYPVAEFRNYRGDAVVIFKK